MNDLYLSPSENHQWLMGQMKQTMAFDGADVETWQRHLHGKVSEVLGDVPETRCDLQVRRLWIREHPLGVIEKIVFTAEPYADVSAYVCLPKDVPAPYNFFICLQGHSTGMHNSIAVQRDDNIKPHVVEGDRDFGLGCMRRGLAALCIEQRAFGERRELKQAASESFGCYDPAMQALMLGRTLLGERVYDVDRSIDYLATRDDVRMDTLGVMGNSGGGTVSLFAAALLPRIALAMPSCYFCTFADSIMAMRHCICNYVPGLLKVAEMSDIMGLFAPKPLVLVAGLEDQIFPIEGARQEFEKLQAIYRAAGAPDRCHLVVGAGGHRFYADDAWPVMLAELARLQKDMGSTEGKRK